MDDQSVLAASPEIKRAKVKMRTKWEVEGKEECC